MFILQVRRCYVCKEPKNILEFDRNKTKTFGYSYTCKPCTAITAHNKKAAQRRYKVRQRLMKAKLRALFRVLLEDPELVQMIISRHRSKYKLYCDEEMTKVANLEVLMDERHQRNFPNLVEWVKTIPRDSTGKWTSKGVITDQELVVT